MVNDHYSILGITKDSGDHEIKRAYRKLMKDYHPDKNKAPNAKETFKKIEEAYQFLISKKKLGAEWHKATNPIIENDLYVKWEDMVKGCRKRLKITRTIFGVDGSQTKVEKFLMAYIKPGCTPGTRITFPGEGDHHLGKLPADIVYIVRVKLNPNPGPNGETGNAGERNGHQNQVPKAEGNPEKNNVPKLRKVLRQTNEFGISSSNPSPLYSSVTAFDDLPLRPELKKSICTMGFDAPSKFQETALPILLCDPPQNLIAQSESGTGKTVTFVLAMLNRVDPTLKYPQALYLSPTYELALQTGRMVEEMGIFCPEIKVRYELNEKIVAGTIFEEQILIGTPGKVLDWAFHNQCFDIGKIKSFCLDEADIMLDIQDFRDQFIKIHGSLLQDCQQMLFSTTYNFNVMRLAKRLIPHATVIKLRREKKSLNNIKQCYIECNSSEEKYEAIATIYGFITVGRTIIFCETKSEASWLADKLTKDTHSVGILHGELETSQRVEILNRFRESRVKILIVTNTIVARGIDVEQVTLVVNYDLPINTNGQPDFDTYLHRLGRTGRFGRMGIAINLVNGPKMMDVLTKICDHFGKSIKKLNVDDVDEMEKLGLG